MEAAPLPRCSVGTSDPDQTNGNGIVTIGVIWTFGWDKCNCSSPLRRVWDLSLPLWMQLKRIGFTDHVVPNLAVPVWSEPLQRLGGAGCSLGVEMLRFTVFLDGGV